MSERLFGFVAGGGLKGVSASACHHRLNLFGNTDLPRLFRSKINRDNGLRGKERRYSDEQIVRVLRETDKDTIAAVAKRHGVSEASIYAWKKKFGRTVVDEVTRECLAIDVGGSIRAERVIEVLDRLIGLHGAPDYPRGPRKCLHFWGEFEERQWPRVRQRQIAGVGD